MTDSRLPVADRAACGAAPKARATASLVAVLVLAWPLALPAPGLAVEDARSPRTDARARSAPPETSPPDRRQAAAAEAVFDAAGMATHVLALGDALRRAAEESAASHPGDTAARALLARVDESVREATLVAAARERFARAAEPGAADAALAFLHSPTGRRLRAIESAADQTLADEEAVARFVDALFARPVDLDRVRLLERLASGARAGELAAAIEAAAERALTLALLGEGAERDATLERIEATRRRVAETWSARTIVLLQLVYRDATDDELRAYVTFAESPAGGWLAGASLALVDALEVWLTERLSSGGLEPVAAPSR